VSTLVMVWSGFEQSTCHFSLGDERPDDEIHSFINQFKEAQASSSR
jgi:hypothetical protein